MEFFRKDHDIFDIWNDDRHNRCSFPKQSLHSECVEDAFMVENFGAICADYRHAHSISLTKKVFRT